MTKFSIGLIVLATVVLGLGINYLYVNPKKTTAEYTATKVVQKELIQTIKVPGTIVPVTRVQLFPPISGRVEALFVKEGDWVDKGELVAEISSGERATILDVARSEGPDQLAYWKSVYKPIRIYAPIRGRVIVLDATIAQIVSSTSPLMTLSDQLILKAQIDETDMAKVAEGMKATVVLYTYPKHPIRARVYRMSYESTVVNGVSVYEIDIAFTEMPQFLRSGMTGSALVEIAKRSDARVIPERFIKYQNGVPFVFVGQHGPETQRQIGIGIRQNGEAEIVDGLETGEWVWTEVVHQGAKSEAGYNPFEIKKKKNE